MLTGQGRTRKKKTKTQTRNLNFVRVKNGSKEENTKKI